MPAEQAVTEIVITAQQAEATLARIDAAYGHLGDRAEAAQAKAAAAWERQTQSLTRLPQSIDRVGAAYDKIQGALNPVVAAQLRAEKEMTSSLAVINRAVLLNVTTQEQAAKDIAALRTRQIADIERVKAAQLGANATPVAANQNRRLSGMQFQQLGYQANDIVTMALLGAPVSQIAASQGGQILQGLQMGEGGVSGSLKAIKSTAVDATSAVVGFLGPVGLIASGFGLAAAAAGAFYLLNRAKAKTDEELIKAEADAIRDLGTAYGDAAAARKQFSDTPTVAGFGLSSSNTESGLRIGLSRDVQSMQSDIGRFINPGKSAGGFFDIAGEFQPFSDAIDYLRKTAKDGTPDIIGFRKMVEDRWALDPNNAALTKTAGKLEDMTDKSVGLAKALRDLKAVQDALVNNQNAGPGGLPLYIDPNAGNAARDKAISDRDTQINRMRQGFDAANSNVNAKSPEERAAAARQQAASSYVSGEDPQVRQLRIDQAGQRAQIDAQHQLDEAQKERKRSLDQTLASQQLDLDVIGKTTGQVAAMRLEFQLTQQLREEAARNNVPVDQKELDLIKQRTAAYGQMADAIQRAQLGNDLAFERSQMFLSSDDQAVASRLRGTGLGADSPEAQTMRQNQQLGELKTASQAFTSTFAATLQSSGGDIGKSFGAALLAGLQNYEQKAIEQLGDILFKVISGALGMSAPGATAAGSFGTVDGFAKMLGMGGAANDNYAAGAVTRAPLPAVGALKATSDVAAYIKQASIARNIDPEIALKVAKSEGLGDGIWQSNYVKDGFREPSFGPFQLLKGGKGTGFPTGLGNQFMAQTGLDPSDPANVAPGIDFALDHAAKNGWGDWYGAKAAGIGNMQGLTGAMPIGVGSASIDKFNAAVDKASGSLGGLDSTVTNTVQSLAGGIGGSGGLSSILDSLKPENFQANTTLSAILGAGGGAPAAPSGGSGIFGDLLSFIPKLFGFAGGTNFAPGGLAQINERGGEIVDLPRGSRVIPHDVSMRMATNANRQATPAPAPQPGKVELHVHVNGGSGDDHVRMLARQGAQEAIGDYNQSLESGGIGELQRRFNSQKG